ncbi:MAG: hypothetical protein EX286_03130 [Candidatus Nitrosopelagicus brevis]|nr:hypothetical protein [Candidatus Nitrosopelagicus brevis]
MKLTLFKISLLLIVIGASGTGIVFSEADRSFQIMSLKQTESDEISMYVEIDDIGYHKISIPEYDGEGVLYRIVDDDYNTVNKGIAETKMSIRYFDVRETGVYTIILTSLAQENMNYEVELGSTNALIISIPAGVMFVGGLLLLFASYMKLKNYRIAQPDEKIK